MVSTLKRTCAKCFHASPIIPSTASRNCCRGTSQQNSSQNQAALHSQLQYVKTVCDRRLLNDCDNTEHSVEVYAESLYESVLRRGLSRLQYPWSESDRNKPIQRGRGG